MKQRNWSKIIFYIVILLILALIPVFLTNLYHITVVTMILINSLLAAGLWLILMTGQVSLGHGGFAAIGGFMSAAFVTAYGMNSWLALLIAIVISGLIGLTIGYITLRIKGVYFIIATLAFGEFIRIVFGMWEHPFGGLHGIMGIPAPDPIGIPGLFTIQFGSNIEIYYLTLVLTLIGIIVIHRVYSGPIGRVFRSISQADELAENVGINIMRYKVLAFVIACMFAGLAGALYTYSTRYISPISFTIPQSAYYLLCIAVGGGASVAGPILGATFLGIFGEFVRPVQQYQPIVFGVLLIICVLYFKSGILGVWQKMRRYLLRLMNRKISDYA